MGLDGMRGIAAFAVMLSHQIGVFLPGKIPPLPFSIAVDLFFMLSGFVLAHAYGEKLDHGMGWLEYMAARMIRLYPMIVLGVTLGGIFEFAKWQLQGQHNPHAGPVDFAANLILVPIGVWHSAQHVPFTDEAPYAFDDPMWSLFFEVAASAAFGVFAVRHLKTAMLAFTISVAAVGIVAMSFHYGSIGSLGFTGVVPFLGGFVRVFFSFALGAILYRTGVYRGLPSLPALPLGMTLAFVLLTPTPWLVPYQLICVFFLFPVAIGLGAQLSLSKAEVRASAMLGRFSYPVYLLHLPISLMVGYAVKQVFPNPYLLIFVSFAATLFGSWIALIVYDEPIRSRLRTALRRYEKYASTAAS